MAAAAVEMMSSLPSQDNVDKPQNPSKGLFIKALNIYYSVIKKHKPEPPPHLLEGMEPLDKDMNIKQLLFAARGLLTEIPLRRVWLMVQYPPMAEYAECLLRDQEHDLIRAKEIAKELLECAESRHEMAQVLHMLVVMGSKANHVNHFKLENMLIDELCPPEDKLFDSLHEPADWNEITSIGSWKNRTEMFKAKADKMDSFELYEALLMAAEHANWDIFYDCAQRGVKLNGPPTECKENKATGRAPDARVPEESGSPKVLLGPSPVHVALMTGVFSLSELAGKVQLGDDILKSVDHTGTPLLHLAALYDKGSAENIKFLMRHGADVNAKDSHGLTVLQHLINKAVRNLGLATPQPQSEGPENESAKNEEPAFKELEKLKQTWATRRIDIMATLITEAVQDGQEINWEAGEDGWTVLHVMCALGAHQHIMMCVNHGADPKDLRQDLTLIDTVIMQDRLPAYRKIPTLRLLLSVVKMGPFHMKIVRHRVHHDTGRTSASQDKAYRYPLLHLLGSGHGVNFEVLKMLYNNEALWLEELKDATTQQGLKWTLPTLASMRH